MCYLLGNSNANQDDESFKHTSEVDKMINLMGLKSGLLDNAVPFWDMRFKN